MYNIFPSLINWSFFFVWLLWNWDIMHTCLNIWVPEFQVSFFFFFF